MHPFFTTHYTLKGNMVPQQLCDRDLILWLLFQSHILDPCARLGLQKNIYKNCQNDISYD
jgi:hypothetical protein